MATESPHVAATLAELKALCSDPAFVLAQLEAGASVSQAREAWNTAQLAEAQRQLAAMQKELTELRTKPRGPDPLPLGGAAGQPAQRQDFMALVRARRDALFPAFAGDRFGRGIRQAMSSVVSESPDLYNDFRKNGGR